MKEPPIILSVGGSLIVPGAGIDFDFLSKLNDFIRDHVKRGKRFFLVTGGGRTARHYRDAGKAVIGNMSDDDLDWLGIHATRLNAHLLRTIFEDIAHPRIIENYDKKLFNWREPVVIGAGWKPGWSTDYDAVVLARDYGANLIINLSNIDWVYDSDPRTNPDAKPLEKITWGDMEKLVGTEWSPGTNAPFDPVAAQLAKKLGLTVVVANGLNFKNMEDILEGHPFIGTVIMPHRIDAGYYNKEYYTQKVRSGYRFTSYESSVGRAISLLVNVYRALVIKVFLNPRNVLDLGAGTGRLVWALRLFGIDAHGVEISDDALELSDSTIKKYIKIGDIAKLPFEDNTFDLVVSFDVMEHIERPNIEKSINESIRVSRKYIFHKIYTRENTWISMFHKRDFSHVSVFSHRFWKKMFLANENVILQRRPMFKLPTFFESLFLMKKK